MRFHPAGRNHIIISLALFFAALASMIFYCICWCTILALIATTLILIFVLQFFRYPKRNLVQFKSGEIYAPADGKVVVIEKVKESKHLNEERMQVSIFMSPLNVHVNWTPCSGKVDFAELIPGQYLFARNPKSSELNEHSEIVINHNGDRIYCKQIAGVMARRIMCDVSRGMDLKYSDEIGFIKFGSRVDLLLPLDYEILVSLEQTTKGNSTLVARKK